MPEEVSATGHLAGRTGLDLRDAEQVHYAPNPDTALTWADLCTCLSWYRPMFGLISI